MAVDAEEVEQRLPIEIVFPSPVSDLALVATGALLCTANIGRVTGFAQGTEVFQVQNSLTDPDDCGEDNLTFGVNAASPAGVVFDRLVIEGVDPWVFEINGNEGRARLEYVFTYVSAPTQQALLASCIPLTPARGDNVRCTARLAIPAGFVVTEKRAKSAGLQIRDRSRINAAAGDEIVWEGPALESTEVTFRATVTDSAGTRAYSSSPVGFQVSARSWPEWNLSTLRAVSYLIAPNMTARLTSGSTLGSMQELLPQGVYDENMPVLVAGSGPNTGLAYLAAPVHISEIDVVVHPALNLAAYSPTAPAYAAAQSWVSDQNAIGGGNCSSSAIPLLRASVERHEGVGFLPNSHPGVGNVQIGVLRPARRLEKLVAKRDSVSFTKMVVKEITDFFNKGAYKTAQDSFDVQDTPVVLASAGCSFDFDIRNP